jgi:hypothetical protein
MNKETNTKIRRAITRLYVDNETGVRSFDEAWVAIKKSKETIFEERRTAKSKDVRIQFTTSHHFIVLDEEGNQKYNGFIASEKPDKLDYCKCKSFENGNFTKAEGDYVTTHGYAFQCKHVMSARDEYIKAHTQRLAEN